MADDVKNEEKVNPFAAEVLAENAKRTGKGTRLKFGSTRGKGTMPIKYEFFDEAQPDTLPGSLAEFASLTGIQDPATLLGFILVGYNDAQYVAASDPIAEFVVPSWPDERKLAFRLAVRNYSKAMTSAGIETSIEDAAVFIKGRMEQGSK